VPSVILGLRPGGQVGADAGPAFSRLTDRERQILAELTAGISTAEIAERLHISPLTVRSHVKSILSKLNVHSKLEAVTLAMRHGMFQDERRA